MMTLPFPWLLLIFYETSEMWRFSCKRPLLQGLGDDTYFMWKRNLKMMVFLLQLYNSGLLIDAPTSLQQPRHGAEDALVQLSLLALK